jgi:arylsulfatase A-like enzyme
MLSAMFLAPHPPFDVPDPWYSMVDEIELPPTVGRWCDGQSPLQLYNLTGFVGARYSRNDWKEVWRVYAGLVSLLDHCVGEIVAKLKAEGIYDDTLIVFTTDHGEMLGSHALWQKMCQEAIRTPVLFKPPASMSCTSQCEQPVSHIDVVPTVCDMLGITPPENLPGVSLAKQMSTGAAAPPRDLYVQYDGNGGFGNFQRCIIRAPHKLIVDTFKDEMFFELYDLAEDVLERRNLVFEQSGLAAELLSGLITHMRATGDHLELNAEQLHAFLMQRSRTASHGTL